MRSQGLGWGTETAFGSEHINRSTRSPPMRSLIVCTAFGLVALFASSASAFGGVNLGGAHGAVPSASKSKHADKGHTGKARNIGGARFSREMFRSRIRRAGRN